MRITTKFGYGFILVFTLICTPIQIHAQETPPDAEENTEQDDGGGWFSWFTDLFSSSDNAESEPQEEEGENYKTLTQEQLNGEFVKMAIRGNTSTMAQLLRLGANVNSRDKQGRTALIEVSRKGDVSTARWLIMRGASVNAKDMYDGTALIYATQEGNREVVNLLIQNGARKETF